MLHPNISGWTFGYKPEATTTMMQRMSESSTLRCVGMALTLSEGWIVPDDVKLWGLGVGGRHGIRQHFPPCWGKKGAREQHQEQPSKTRLHSEDSILPGRQSLLRTPISPSTGPRHRVDEPAAATGLSGVGGISSGLLLRTNRQLTACTRFTGKSFNFPTLLKER